MGAGSGQHIRYVKEDYSKYIMTDKNADLIFKNVPKSKNNNIEYKVADVMNLPFKSKSFDRVIATCILHHLSDFEKALSEIKRVVRYGGLVSIYLSCDPGLMNRLLRKLLIIPKARKLGFYDYSLLIAREHRNHFESIKTVIEHTFLGQVIHVTYYPFKIKSWNLNTFCIIQIQINSE